MDQEQFSLSYGGNEYIDDYFYNSPAGNITNRTILMKTQHYLIFSSNQITTMMNLIVKTKTNNRSGAICHFINCAHSVLCLLFGVLVIYWAQPLFYVFCSDYSLL